eukprot:2324299-Amphidinium_carterae.1
MSSYERASPNLMENVKIQPSCSSKLEHHTACQRSIHEAPLVLLLTSLDLLGAGGGDRLNAM